ncbi:MAG TPA: peptidylprolyl isomerase [Acetivibrio sp.]|uniref:peptidylprolyl isomerase n=1 Tax=Acetivibrio sp. TaxID=1872092 RepID=UPI002BE7B630|nr:peptidylprolyl isomerase [Acetivibrio sp.]HOM01793.1 peptidylprolyl isomerase [Acetivibrio sp.]
MLGRINTKFLAIILICLMTAVFTVGCKDSNTTVKHPKVQIEMEDGGKMILELYPEYAPETVQNFISLAEEGFYDGLTFHRIIKGFMIQGGDPNGDGTGGSGKNIKGEFASNGFNQNTLSHTRGVISMARKSNDPNSATSQFFIMHADAPGLDGDYAAFGKLIEGEDVLDKIADTPVAQNPSMPSEKSVPLEEVKIKTITVLEK